MAVKISDLSVITTATDDDYYPMVDPGSGQTRRITKADLLKELRLGTDLADQAVKANKANFSVADQTARDALTPFEGLMVYRKDLDLFQFYTGSRWRWLSPRIFAQTFPGANFLLTTSYTDRITAPSITTLGGEVEIEFNIAFYNANSGADRTMDVRLLCDGVQLKEIAGISSMLNGTAASVDVIPYIFRHTPTAAAHVYKIQAKASVGSAVYLTTDSYITIKEIG